MYLNIENVEKGYGSGEGYVKVLKGVSTGVEQGEMCVLLGPSGSGKSTLLNMIGGLDRVEKGAVTIDDLNIVGLSPGNYQGIDVSTLDLFFNSTI